MTRTRHTSTRTIDRIANMRRLIAELGKGEMARKAIERFLGMSQAGARSYAHDMLDGGIIELARRLPAAQARNGEPVYKLVADAEQIGRFLAELSQSDGRKTKAWERSEVAIASRTPGRLFHLLEDDMAFQVKVCNVIPRHTALHVAFFGRAA